MTQLQHGYNPKFDFKVDLAYGMAGEAELISFFNSVEGSKVEVKSDRYRNGKMTIETQCLDDYKRWCQSGINVTAADWWAYRFAPGSFVLVSIPRLKKYLRLNKGHLEKWEFAKGSRHPTKGFLLTTEQVTEMMTSEWYDPD
jgi:hypothetical protein